MSNVSERRKQTVVLHEIRVAVYDALCEMYEDEGDTKKPNSDYVEDLARLLYVHGVTVEVGE